MMQFHLNTLPTATAQLAALIQEKQSELPFLSDFYLSGGTGLSLQLGHRESEDLDFFSQTSFIPEQVQQQLLTLGSLSQTELALGTINTYINGVKLQFLEYPYNLLEPQKNWNCIQLSSVIDIACTKLQTISMRGSKKDFIDLYFIFEKFSLDELFNKLDQKYVTIDYSKTHILKSLTYFDDADQQPMPRMIHSVSWEHVKSQIVSAVKNFRFE
jgi:hypothetical protein